MGSRPVINVDEEIGKTVGHRLPAEPFSSVHSSKAAAFGWQKALSCRLPRRGAYYICSHEEAHEWMMNQTGPLKT